MGHAHGCMRARAHPSIPISRNANSDRQTEGSWKELSWGAIELDLHNYWCLTHLLSWLPKLAHAILFCAMVWLKLLIQVVCLPSFLFGLLASTCVWSSYVRIGISMATAATSFSEHKMRVRSRLLSAWPKWNGNEWSQTHTHTHTNTFIHLYLLIHTQTYNCAKIARRCININYRCLSGNGITHKKPATIQ